MRIGYTHGSHYFANFYYYIAKLMNWGHNSVVQSTQCDIFFYSFLNVKDARKCKKGTRLVFVSGECWDTTKFPCSLLIDCKDIIKQQCPTLYYPFYVLSLFERNGDSSGTQLIKSPTFDSRAVLSQKTKFCAFMYNYNINFRVKLYDDINSYKPVDALGKSRNVNPHAQTDRGNAFYMNSAVDKYKPYKFVICCENKKFPGYVTEKIINAMLAQSIPIYYGDPNVATHFNPKSFIDISSFQTCEDAIEFIKRVDQDDELYCSILKEPWYHNNTPSKYFDPNYVKEAFQVFCNTKVNNHNPQIQRSLRNVQRNTTRPKSVQRNTTRQKSMQRNTTRPNSMQRNTTRPNSMQRNTTRPNSMQRNTMPVQRVGMKKIIPAWPVVSNNSRSRMTPSLRYLTRRTNQIRKRGFRSLDRNRHVMLTLTRTK